MRQTKAAVINRTMLAGDICLLEVNDPVLAAKSQPGQFVQIHCGGGINSILRRPLSIHQAGKESAAFLFQVKGEGTRWLADRSPGSIVDILGPLGRGFKLAAGGSIALVAGGIGLAPLFFLCRRAVRGNLEVTVFIGAKDASRVFLSRELEQAGAKVFITTEDGSMGTKGLVTDTLEEYLNEHRPDGIYTCGPRPMMAEVARLGTGKGIITEVSLEARMACGLGACRGCVTPVRREGRIAYVNVCSTGPVFSAEEVFFNE